MKYIELSNIPNQEISLTIEDIKYLIRFKSSDLGIFYDISIDDIKLNGFTLIDRNPLIPYKYLTKKGNFIFVKKYEDDFDYLKFNSSQILFYLDENEMKQFNKDFYFEFR